MNNSTFLLILPPFLLILGITEIIFADKFAAFYKKTTKYEWRPTVKPMPESHYTPGPVRMIGVAMIIFSIFIALLVIFGEK